MDVAVSDIPMALVIGVARSILPVSRVHNKSESVLNRLCAPVYSFVIQTLMIFKTPVSKVMLSLQGHLSSSFTNVVSSIFISYQDGSEGSRYCFLPFPEGEIG